MKKTERYNQENGDSEANPAFNEWCMDNAGDFAENFAKNDELRKQVLQEIVGGLATSAVLPHRNFDEHDVSHGILPDNEVVTIRGTESVTPAETPPEEEWTPESKDVIANDIQQVEPLDVNDRYRFF